jgi:putative transposase
MSYVRVMIHAVWGTKNRVPFLTPDIRKIVTDHIKENARLKQIYIDTIDGHSEHLHCLIGLNADRSIAKTLNLLKGESAHWINKNGIIKKRFEWADEYFAVSVSESIVPRVRRYILNQDQHHRKVSFSQEYNEFFIRYRFRIHD